MDQKLVVVATFATPEEAGLARAQLDAEGIKATLSDEAMVGNFWHMGNALGGVKLLVFESDSLRASKILDHLEEEVETSGAEDWEASASDNLTEDEDEAILSPEVEANDAMAQRAYRAAIIGLFTAFLPLLVLYSLYYLMPLSFQDRPLSSRGQRHFYIAWLVNILAVGAIMFFIGIFARHG